MKKTIYQRIREAAENKGLEVNEAILTVIVKRLNEIAEVWELDDYEKESLINREIDYIISLKGEFFWQQWEKEREEEKVNDLNKDLDDVLHDVLQSDAEDDEPYDEEEDYESQSDVIFQEDPRFSDAINSVRVSAKCDCGAEYTTRMVADFNEEDNITFSEKYDCYILHGDVTPYLHTLDTEELMKLKQYMDEDKVLTNDMFIAMLDLDDKDLELYKTFVDGTNIYKSKIFNTLVIPSSSIAANAIVKSSPEVQMEMLSELVDNKCIDMDQYGDLLERVKSYRKRLVK